MISEEQAEEIGRQVFEKYMKDGEVDAQRMIRDAQKLLGYEYNPTEQEIKDYKEKILCINPDKPITSSLFEKLAINIFSTQITNEQILNEQIVEKTINSKK